MKKLVFSVLAISSMAFGQIEKKVGDFNIHRSSPDPPQ